jgi:hypothetical protein
MPSSIRLFWNMSAPNYSAITKAVYNQNKWLYSPLMHTVHFGSAVLPSIPGAWRGLNKAMLDYITREIRS